MCSESVDDSDELIANDNPGSPASPHDDTERDRSQSRPERWADDRDEDASQDDDIHSGKHHEPTHAR